MKKNKLENLNNKNFETDAETIKIPVIEEQIIVDKEIVETGKVRISKSVSKEQQSVDIPVNSEKVSIVRVPKNQFIERSPEVRQTGDTLVVPVVREQIVIEKKLVLVEELHIKKELIETSQTEKVTLRKEEVDIVRE